MVNPILKNAFLFIAAISLFVSLTTSAQDHQNDFFFHQQRYNSIKSNQNDFVSLSVSDSILDEVYHWKWGKCWTAQGYRDSLIVIGNGLLIQFLDISDPYHPVIVSEFDGGFESEVQNILIREKFLYVYTPSDIYIYLIEDEHNIHFLSLLQDVGRIIELNDSLLVSGGTWLSTRLFNIKDPENPVSLSFVDVPGGACSIGFYENYLYITARDYPALFIYDISNPDQPVFINTYSTYNMCATFKIFENYLFLVNYSPQQAFQILGLEQDPINPNLISWMDLDSLAGNYIIKKDSILYMSQWYGITSAINVADVYNPELLTFFFDPNKKLIGNEDLGILNDYLLLAYRNGPMFLKLEPDSLKETGKFFTADEINAFAHKQSILYLASGFSGVWIFDINDPENPIRIKNFLENKWIFDVKVYKNLLIVYGSIPGSYEAKLNFKIFDITNPLQPRLLSEIDNYKPYWPHKLRKADFEIQDDYFFIAHPDSGIFVIDIHDPSNPQPISFIYTPDSRQEVRDISLYGDYLYLANRLNGLKIFDISDPYHISILDSLKNVVPYLVLAKDNYLYLAQNSNSKIYDITNPVNPSYISDLPIGGNRIEIVDETNGYWYLCGGLTWVVDIEDKYNPTIVDTLSPYVIIPQLYLLDNKYLFINDGGFKIYENQSVLSLVEKQLSYPNSKINVKYYPNPFNNQITFEFHSSSLKEVRLNIYDILGQLIWSKVIRLKDNHNNNKITWSATSKSRTSVSSGIYFIKIYSNNQPVNTGKILYLK